VRCLKNDTCVSVDGTFLGRWEKDESGNNRYSINLVSISGNPTKD